MSTFLTSKCASRHNGVHFFDTFSTSEPPKVVRDRQFLTLLTWKCASRHNGVHFFDISTSKSGPNLVCFVHFDLEMCFAPQRRALFQHLNFQKWSENGVVCTFWLGNVLRATTACTFSTSQLPKVVRSWCVLYILTWKCASRHNGVHFFISHLASWVRTRRFSEPTFRPSRATNHWKNTVNRDFPTFSRICIFFLLIFSLLSLLTSAFQLSILSEVSLLNFLRPYLNWFKDPSQLLGIRPHLSPLNIVSVSNLEGSQKWPWRSRCCRKARGGVARCRCVGPQHSYIPRSAVLGPDDLGWPGMDACFWSKKCQNLGLSMCFMCFSMISLYLNEPQFASYTRMLTRVPRFCSTAMETNKDADLMWGAEQLPGRVDSAIAFGYGFDQKVAPRVKLGWWMLKVWLAHLQKFPWVLQFEYRPVLVSALRHLSLVALPSILDMSELYQLRLRVSSCMFEMNYCINQPIKFSWNWRPKGRSKAASARLQREAKSLDKENEIFYVIISHPEFGWIVRGSDNCHICSWSFHDHFMIISWSFHDDKP